MQHRNGRKLSINNGSTATVAIKQNLGAHNNISPSNGAKTNHELVVVRANGKVVTVDLIEHSPELP